MTLGASEPGDPTLRSSLPLQPLKLARHACTVARRVWRPFSPRSEGAGDHEQGAGWVELGRRVTEHLQLVLGAIHARIQ
eukprot:7309857-Prymnesium_polylepis.1